MTLCSHGRFCKSGDTNSEAAAPVKELGASKSGSSFGLWMVLCIVSSADAISCDLKLACFHRYQNELIIVSPC